MQTAHCTLRVGGWCCVFCGRADASCAPHFIDMQCINVSYMRRADWYMWYRRFGSRHRGHLGPYPISYRHRAIDRHRRIFSSESPASRRPAQPTIYTACVCVALHTPRAPPLHNSTGVLINLTNNTTYTCKPTPRSLRQGLQAPHRSTLHSHTVYYKYAARAPPETPSPTPAPTSKRERVVAARVQ